MKQKRLLLAILAMAMMVPAVAQRDKSKLKNPDEATYSIRGTMQVTNGKRYLNDARGTNIQFEYVSSRYAAPTQMADLVVRFDSIKTTHPGGMTRLDFWRYDEEVGEWVYDSEVRQGENQLESTMKTNIMLVVDNSKSLGDDFKKVQDAAIEFVGQLYRESQGRDIFRIGVIGFSTVQFTKIREITPLDATNYKQIVSFIRSLEMQNGTAFYYSLEKALDMLENDARTSIAKDEYKESRIYAFTDGLDQASVDDSRNLSTPTQYYDHLRPMMKGIQRKKIMGLPKKSVHSTIVTVRGDDMTDKQEKLFDQRAQEICDNVRKLTDMNQLVAEFKKLASDLVNSNYVLYCYIPVGANGRVGWTFAEDKVVVKERKPSKFWLGVALQGQYGYYEEQGQYGYYEEVKAHYHYGYYDYHYIEEYASIGVRVDAIVPIGKSFGLGASISGSWGSWFLGDAGLIIEGGLLSKVAFKNNSALLLGVGVQYITDYEDIKPYISLGWKTKSPWYIVANLYFDGSEGTWGGIGLGVGYSIFGGK